MAASPVVTLVSTLLGGHLDHRLVASASNPTRRNTVARTPRKAIVVAHVLLWVLLGRPPLDAQESQEVPSTVTCAPCRIQIAKLFSIGSLDGPGAIPGAPQAIAMDARGRIYASFELAPNELRAFDHAGRPLGRIGRTGSGPGEFRDVSEIVVMPGDSIAVFDGGNNRVTIFSSDWEVARSFPLAGWVDSAARLPGGELVVNMHIATPDLVGLPMHILGPDGGISRSFQADSQAYRADAPHMVLRQLAATADGQLWSGRRSEYVLELWQPTGKLQVRLTRSADWFTPWVRPWEASPSRPPVSHLQDITVDASGRLWTAVLVADRNYRDALNPEPQIMEGQTVYTLVKSVEHYVDTIIEVIDPRTGAVVTRARTPHAVVGWIDNDHIVSYREENDVPVLDVWQIDVTSQSGRQR